MARCLPQSIYSGKAMLVNDGGFAPSIFCGVIPLSNLDWEITDYGSIGSKRRGGR